MLERPDTEDMQQAVRRKDRVVRYPGDLTAEDMRPNARLNMALGVGIAAAGISLQWAASHVDSVWATVGIGVGFAFVYLPLYTLMHEAMHRCFHSDRHVNDRWGVALSSLFPGPFTFLRACHLGHHRRNRTDAERFDGYYPHESKWISRLKFYPTYLGLFWLSVPLATLLLAFVPRALNTALLRDGPRVGAMVRGLPTRWVRRCRVEALIVIAIQVALFVLLDLRWWSYLLLYAMFGFSWSSQNYITHAFSPRDVLNGAYNLRPGPLYGALLLNFHWHLAHHQYPNVPWTKLPRLDDPTRERPGYLFAWLRQWTGPRPVEAPAPQERPRGAEEAEL